MINLSLYSSLGGAVSFGILSYVLGSPFAALVLLACGLVGAAVFAQVLWGSNRLARSLRILGSGRRRWSWGTYRHFCLWYSSRITIALAALLCAPFAQTIARLRCLVQGCCHGTVTTKKLGIPIWQSQSRVVAISGLKGHYILNTQLCSMLFNIPLGFLLWSLWLSQGVSSSL